MQNSTSAFCPEAYNWLFAQLNLASFCRKLQTRHDYSGMLHLLTNGGFKLNEKTVAMRKDHLYRNLSRLPDGGILMADIVIDADGPWHLVHAVFQTLKEEQLRDDWRNIITAAEVPGYAILALLMFNRGTWQNRLGRRLLRAPSAWRGCDDSTRKNNENFRLIINGMMAMFAKELTVKPQTSTRPENAQPINDDALKQLLEKEYKRGRAEQEKKTADDKRDREAKLREATRMLQESRDETARLSAELDTLKQTFDKEKRQLAHQLESSHQDSIRQLMEQTFLADHDLQFKTIESQTDTDRLLSKLAQATEAQTALNQKSGSRHALREQRKKLQAAIEELKRAQQDAVVSIKSIPSLLREADQQLLKIESTLKDDDAITSLACSQLTAFINAIKLDSNAETALRQALKFVKDAYEHELLHEGEVALLEDLVAQRLTILRNSSIASALTKSLESLETLPPLRTREIWNLALDLPRLKHVTLVIDACNAILRTPVWSKMTANYTFEQAKQHFIQSCVSKRHCFHSIEIVFDGTNLLTTSEKFADNVTVTFAAKKEEEHNADEVIIAMVPRLKASEDHELVWVVTDDYGLRDKLEDVCDAFVRTFAVPSFFLTN